MDAKRYNLFEHRHRFAAWAAARAAQRGLTSVEILCQALDDSTIKQFVRDHFEEPITAEEFQKLHCKWCKKIVNSLKRNGVKDVPFGRAAKLVGVYLKSMIVVGPHSDADLAKVVHPPVDRLLLQELARHVLGERRKTFRKTAWTELSEDDYYQLIHQLRQEVPESEPFWHLERHWKGPLSSDD